MHHLWAGQRIATLGDQEALEGSAPHKPAITELGLRSGLPRPYTSFIAIDHGVRNNNPALGREVRQPLSLPEGVSRLAVGGALGAAVPSTPEPAKWGAIAITLLMLVAAMRARHRRGA